MKYFFSILLVCLFFLTFLGASHSNNEKYLDGRGNVLGYKNGDRIEDRNRSLIGFIRSGKTYSKNGSIVSYSELPGLLFCK